MQKAKNSDVDVDKLTMAVNAPFSAIVLFASSPSLSESSDVVADPSWLCVSDRIVNVLLLSLTAVDWGTRSYPLSVGSEISSIYFRISSAVGGFWCRFYTRSI